MSELRYTETPGTFYWCGAYQDRHIPKDAGFRWDADKCVWVANNQWQALVMALRGGVKLNYQAERKLSKLLKRVQASRATEADATKPVPVAPEGKQYKSYQIAAAQYVGTMPVAYVADDMGLGKTIEAIAIANQNKHERIFVACPAILRLNWQRELIAWHMYNKKVEVVLSKADLMKAYRHNVSVVTSYDLLCGFDRELLDMLECRWDLMVLDEAHYLKNEKTQRTKRIFGDKDQRGLAQCAKQLLLMSGTPITNGPIEFYSQLSAICPQVVGGMNYWQFAHKFCKVENIVIGRKPPIAPGKSRRLITKKRVYGASNADELSARLRSQLMIRRTKADVLKQLAPKQYQMIVFSPNAEQRAIIKRERQFNVQEILYSGIPEGSGLPAMRRLMGISKVPLSVEYIENALSQTNKILVGAYHLEVIAMLQDRLSAYNPVVVTGGVGPVKSQAAVDSFQNDPACRVFIGQINAAGVGLTLTAAQDVVLVESSWVPAVDEQFIDRLHRVGQIGNVMVHYLVVEESIDARILSVAAWKREDIAKVLC